MTRRNLAGCSISGLSRRSLLQTSAVLLGVPFIANATRSWAQAKLAGSGEVVVFSYGGSFTEGARQNVFDPFTKATGIRVVDVVADQAEPQVRAMNQAGRIDWDTAFVSAQNYPAMHEAGMFVPIDYSLWDQESIDGTPPHTRLEDAAVLFSTSTVLAYDQRAFPKAGPKSWAEFWDVKTFPGPRGFYATQGKTNMPLTLLAAGVAPKDIWPLTDEKLDRAFGKLEKIKPYITKWWASGGEPAQLLINREYAMTSVFDGRAIAAIRQGAPIKIVWEAGAHLIYMYAAILKGGPNTGNAQKLIAFLNRAQIAAGWTLGTGYPGPNTNQIKYLPAGLAEILSISPENASKTILQDDTWLAAKRPDGTRNIDYIEKRWLAWRTQ